VKNLWTVLPKILISGQSTAIHWLSLQRSVIVFGHINPTSNRLKQKAPPIGLSDWGLWPPEGWYYSLQQQQYWW